MGALDEVRLVGAHRGGQDHDPRVVVRHQVRREDVVVADARVRDLPRQGRDRVLRLQVHHDRHVAELEVEIDEADLLPGQPLDGAGEVDGEEGAADAALGGEDRDELRLDDLLLLGAQDARHRLLLLLADVGDEADDLDEVARIVGLRKNLPRPGEHRFPEKESVRPLVADDHDVGRRGRDRDRLRRRQAVGIGAGEVGVDDDDRGVLFLDQLQPVLRVVRFPDNLHVLLDEKRLLQLDPFLDLAREDDDANAAGHGPSSARPRGPGSREAAGWESRGEADRSRSPPRSPFRPAARCAP